MSSYSLQIGKTIFKCLNIILIIQNWYYYHFVLLLQLFYKNQSQINTFELTWRPQFRYFIDELKIHYFQHLKPVCKDKFCFSYTLYSMYYPLLLSRHERYRNIAMKMDLRLIHNYTILQIPKKIEKLKIFKILKFAGNF